ncbi:lipoprotein precursor [Neptunitalea chrysea]|uniref:Lipoprotein n=1 Tax=Neptunitalea chrysea TaxID=1647581 RepID=A0A9W6B4E5_9FLAO|nr:DUF4296 domain-containing protein [Neptunitalea chrysea]GLB51405.1 lipoprotein precursor [Neptunitalea chrysea]
MKRILLLIGICTSLYSCKQNLVKEPDNIIPSDKMEKIIYDLSILNAMKAVENGSLKENNINPKEFLFKKYKIDSAQFAKSSVYYAAKNPEAYGEIYERVKAKIEVQVDKIQDSIDAARKELQKEKNKQLSEEKKPVNITIK